MFGGPVPAPEEAVAIHQEALADAKDAEQVVVP